MKTREIDPTKPQNPFGALPQQTKIPEADMAKYKEPSIDISNIKVPPPIDNAVRTEITIDQKPDTSLQPAATSGSPGEGWVRQDVLSNFVPYDFNELWLKPLSLIDLSLLYAASKEGSFSKILDALNNCVSVDIRDLTPEDLTLVMYWIRDNSYRRTPLRIKYKTRYDNDIEIEVRQNHLHMKVLEMTREEFAPYKAKGLCFPTVRDMELIQKQDDLPEAEKYLLGYSQYIAYKPANLDYTNYAQTKMDMIKNHPRQIEVIEDIEEMLSKIEYGVSETLRIRDPEFVPEEAIAFFRDNAKRIAATIEKIPRENYEGMEETILRMVDRVGQFLAEANEIEEALAAGEEVVAKEEVVAIEISATAFFPYVRS